MDVGSSAARVMDIVSRHGKEYVAGELSMERGTAITGSEVATFLGLNRFEKASDATFKKVFGYKTPNNAAMDHGRKTEPIAIDKFEKKTGAKVHFVNFMRHPKYSWLGGTFDGLAIMPDGTGALIEVKCPLNRSISDSVPDYYMPQVQMYLEIAGLDVAYFVQYKPSYVTEVRRFRRDEKLIVTRVDRDPNFMVAAVPRLWEAWVDICAKRAHRLPMANQASVLIAAAWRLHRARTARGETIPDKRATLTMATWDFARARAMSEGTYEMVRGYMEASPPEIPLPDPNVDYYASRVAPNPRKRKSPDKLKTEQRKIVVVEYLS